MQSRIIDLLCGCEVRAKLDQEAADEEKRMLADEEDEDEPPMRLAGD